MTEPEVEEEALLLLVRNYQQGSDNLGDKQVANILQSTSSSSKGARVILDVAPDLESLKQAENEEDEDSESGDEGQDVAAAARGSDALLREASASTDSAAALAAPPLTLSPNLARGLSSWQESAQQALASIRDWHERSSHEVGYNDEISFLYVRNESAKLAAHELFAVLWVDAAKLHGRRVRIDGQNRVVYAPAILFGKKVQPEQFQADNVLITHAGACSRRYAGTLRDTLPPLVVRFLRVAKLMMPYLNKDMPRAS